MGIMGTTGTPATSPILGKRKRPPARPQIALGYVGSDPASFGGGRTPFEQAHASGQVPSQPQQMTDAQLLRPSGAAGQAYDRRLQNQAPGGMAAAGANAGAALMGTPRPFAVTEPTQIGYEAAQLGYHPGHALVSGAAYRGNQVGGPGAGMGVMRHEAGQQEFGAPVAPGGVTVRLSGSYPGSTDAARQQQGASLAGQQQTYVQGGTGAAEAYKAALARGADEATARDAATMMQVQQAAGGAPLTGGQIQQGQAETAAGTAQAQAQAEMFRQAPAMQKAQTILQTAEALGQIPGMEEYAKVLHERAAEAATGGTSVDPFADDWAMQVMRWFWNRNPANWLRWVFGEMPEKQLVVPKRGG